VVFQSSGITSNRPELASAAKPAAPSATPSRPDPVAPARGILLGLAIGALVWVLLILYWTGVL